MALVVQKQPSICWFSVNLSVQPGAIIPSISLSTNEHTIGDIFPFADDLQEMKISDHDILVSYDVSALFTNVPVDESIRTLARKAFKEDWFNKKYNLNITEADLIELLEVSTKNQLFQFQGVLYEQADGVAMGSPLRPLMANAFMCNIEEQTKTRSPLSIDATLTTLSA